MNRYVYSARASRYQTSSFCGEVNKCSTQNFIAKYGTKAHLQYRESVMSYRGKKDRAVSREFEKLFYECRGSSNVFYCTSADRIDGGPNFMYRMMNSTQVTPTLELEADQLVITPEDEPYQNYLIAQLYEKANSARFNSAVFIAELGETIKYIKDVLVSFRRISAFYKAQAKRTKNPHSTWLEWRYAITPLVLTVEDALNSLNKVRPKEKVQAYNKDESEKLKYHTYSQTHGTLSVAKLTKSKFTCGSRLSILAQNDTSPWGTSLHDVVAAAWERVTLSFMIDWFFDVGTWLGSFRDTNLVIGDKYVTFVKEQTHRLWVDTRFSNMPDIYVSPDKDEPFIVSSLHIRRLVGDDVLPPVLPCFVPGKLSLFHQLDGIALLIGALLGLKGR